MATTQIASQPGKVVKVEYEEDGKTRIVHLSNIDDLFKARLSGRRGSRASLLKTRQLVISSKATGKTLRWMTNVIPRDLIAEALEVNPTNLSKLYRRKELSRTQTEGLEDLTHLWRDVAQDLFNGNAELMTRWLDTPVPALEGDTPKALMGTMTGRKVLEGYIDKLKYGDYS
jgi:putative toxin-antitoxin system antitoxin component (TIGR02293 family)